MHLHRYDFHLAFPHTRRMQVLFSLHWPYPCAYACATKDDPAYLNRKDIAILLVLILILLELAFARVLCCSGNSHRFSVLYREFFSTPFM